MNRSYVASPSFISDARYITNDEFRTVRAVFIPLPLGPTKHVFTAHMSKNTVHVKSMEIDHDKDYCEITENK